MESLGSWRRARLQLLRHGRAHAHVRIVRYNATIVSAPRRGRAISVRVNVRTETLSGDDYDRR
eukprot:117627-Prymnesium_polylepis.1